MTYRISLKRHTLQNVFCLFGLLLCNSNANTFADIGEPFFQEYCYSCHGKGEKLRGDLDLLEYASQKSLIADRDLWEDILEQVETEEMPTKKPLPSTEERATFVDWLETELDSVDWSKVQYAGYVSMPLLTKKEYNNTMRDLIGLDVQPGDTLLEDGEGLSGFTTDRSSLFLSPASIEKYMAAAENALDALSGIAPVSSINKKIEAEDMLSGSDAKGVKVKGVLAMRLPIGQVTVYDSITVPADGNYTIEVRGTSYNDDNAGIRVAIDNDVKGILEFPGTGYTVQKMNVFIKKGGHQLTLNKGTDQNKRSEKNGVKVYHKESAFDWVKISSAERSTVSGKGKPLYSLKPSSGVSELNSVKKTLSHFLLRSFRRPVEEEVLNKYVGVFQNLRKQGGSFTFSLRQSMIAILVSPRFLYRNELAPDGLEFLEEYPLDDFQVASRLSYFLWLSMPDVELFSLAKKGKLREPEVLRKQVKRMLADPKARDFSAAFLGQWLGFGSLGTEVVPDAKIFPEFDSQLSDSMKAETILTFEHMIAKDLSLLTLIESKATFLNEKLATHYGIKGIKGERMRPVLLTDPQRGGLLGMGSVLTATSSPTRTSPVNRGIWVIEKLLGERIPEAPADVPEIDEKAGNSEAQTLRQELEKHRDNPECARCHDRIDPIGFGLENFDALGRFRTTEPSGNKIDASGDMNGHKFQGAAELKAWLMEHRREEFTQTVSKNMLAFALGRKIESFDQAPLDKITQALSANDYKASILIEEIVLSYPFLNRSINNEIDPHE